VSSKIVLYKITKYRRTKAFKSTVRVSYGQGKRREDLKVSIRVSVSHQTEFSPLSHITNL